MKFLTNPYINNSFITFILGGIMTLGIWYVSEKKAELKYAVYETSPVANSTSNERLSVFWDSLKVKNVERTFVIIWNDGNEHLGKESFSITQKSRIIACNECQILDVGISKRSRETFNVKKLLKYDSILHRSVMEIEMIGDDVWESKDGIMLSLLYTNPKDSKEKFKVNGRLKGLPEGFVEVPWRSIYPMSKSSGGLKLISVILFFTMINLINIVKDNAKIIESKDKNNVKYPFLLFLVFFALFVYYLWPYIFVTGLNWVN